MKNISEKQEQSAADKLSAMSMKHVRITEMSDGKFQISDGKEAVIVQIVSQ
jgi:hypothetical protein